MQNVGNEVRNIAITKVAKAYLCHRIGSEVINFAVIPNDLLLQDLWLILLNPKVFIREGARDLNIRLDGDVSILPHHYHHTRRHGLLTSYEGILFSNKIEAYLRAQVYSDISRNAKKSAGRVIDDWCDKLGLDPSWSEKMIRTYRNHKLSNYPVFAA